MAWNWESGNTFNRLWTEKTWRVGSDGQYKWGSPSSISYFWTPTNSLIWGRLSKTTIYTPCTSTFLTMTVSTFALMVSLAIASVHGFPANTTAFDSPQNVTTTNTTVFDSPHNVTTTNTTTFDLHNLTTPHTTTLSLGHNSTTTSNKTTEIIWDGRIPVRVALTGFDSYSSKYDPTYVHGDTGHNSTLSDFLFFPNVTSSKVSLTKLSHTTRSTLWGGFEAYENSVKTMLLMRRALITVRYCKQNQSRRSICQRLFGFQQWNTVSPHRAQPHQQTQKWKRPNDWRHHNVPILPPSRSSEAITYKRVPVQPRVHPVWKLPVRRLEAHSRPKLW